MGVPANRGDRRFDYINGYWMVCVKSHPLFPGKTWVAEHRVMMAEHLGRALLPSELVHHKNDNKQDNRIDNFEIHTRGSHLAKHLRGKKLPRSWRESQARAAKKRNMEPKYNAMIRKRAKKQHATGEQYFQPLRRTS